MGNIVGTHLGSLVVVVCLQCCAGLFLGFFQQYMVQAMSLWRFWIFFFLAVIIEQSNRVTVRLLLTHLSGVSAMAFLVDVLWLCGNCSLPAEFSSSLIPMLFFLLNRKCLCSSVRECCVSWSCSSSSNSSSLSAPLFPPSVSPSLALIYSSSILSELLTCRLLLVARKKSLSAEISAQ